ncbi:MAG: sigma 54-interacting transcriptional regulator [Desulfohalobiaceae bacterium]|nr:sigma 54-interacting transcriptional regulator [Desulfohalobiaceae bacterium]
MPTTKETCRKQIERLEETVQELNEVIDLSADGLVSVDSQGILLRMNKAYEDIVGVKARDFIGRPALELKKQGYLPDLVSLQVLKDLRPKHLFVQLEDREVLLTGRPVFNARGKLIRVVANIRDLTDLNNLKDELRKYQDLTSRYQTELKQFRAMESANDLISCSRVMKHVVETAVRASLADATTLISGETGTGKEIVARIIHRAGPRQGGPFITINCAALPETLLEAELFGYEQGAFTGAKSQGQMGLFEAAQGGLLFLVEIGEIPSSMQAKLLRAIQEKKIRRIGGSREIELDLNLVAASNIDLKKKVAESLFRADLYYRLNVIHIRLPPLRQRMEDIPLLVKHFLTLFNEKYKARKEIGQETLDSLFDYDWPGNVRELENIIERLVVLDQGPGLDNELLPVSSPGSAFDQSLSELIEKTEKEAILKTYQQCRSTRKAALKLKISQATMSRKLQKHRQNLKGAQSPIHD